MAKIRTIAEKAPKRAKKGKRKKHKGKHKKQQATGAHKKKRKWVDLQEYYQTRHWQKRRTAFLKKKGRKCQDCGSTKDIRVHHIRYTNLYGEKDKDLEVLCEVCHTNIHMIDPAWLARHPDVIPGMKDMLS